MECLPQSNKNYGKFFTYSCVTYSNAEFYQPYLVSSGIFI